MDDQNTPDDSQPLIDPDVAQKLFEKGHISQQLLDTLVPKVIKAESGGNPNAESGKGAKGLMQVMDATGKEEAQKLGIDNYNPKDPEQNKQIGTAYLGEQLKKYEGEPRLALAAYNAGPGTVDKLRAKFGPNFEDIAPHLPGETQNYVQKVIGSDVASADPKPQSEPPGMMQRIAGGISDMIASPAEADEGQPAAQPQTPGMLDRFANTMADGGNALGRGLEAIPGAISNGASTLANYQGNSSVDASGVIQGTSPQQAPAQTPVAPQPDLNAQYEAGTQAALAQADQSAQQGDANGVVKALGASEQTSDQDYNQSIQNAYALRQQGSDQAANAKISAAQQSAQIQADSAKQIAQEGAQFAEKAQAVDALTQEDLSRYRQKVIDFNNTSINPDALFSGGRTFSTILLGIGAILQARAGDTAGGVKIINDAIDRDLSIQKANLALKGRDIEQEKGLMNANLDYTGSLERGESLSRAQMLASTSARLQQAADNANSDLARAQALDAKGQLQAQMLDEEAKYAKLTQDKNALAALNPSTAGLPPDEALLQKTALSSGPESHLVVTDSNGRYIGKAKSLTAANELATAIKTKDAINSSLNQLREIANSTTGEIPIDPNTAANASYIISNLKTELAASAKASRMAGFMAKQFDKELPDSLFGSDFGLGMAGRAAKKAGVMTGAYADPLQAIDNLQKKTNELFMATAGTNMGYKTKAFINDLIADAAANGTSPNVGKPQ